MKLDLEIKHEAWHPIVVSLDPGGTTGWCAYREGEFFGGQLAGEYHHQQLEFFLDSHNIIAKKTGKELVVVTESFEFRQNNENPEENRKGLELISCEYIGVTRLWAMNHQVKLVTQTAGAGKGFINDRKIQRLGLTEAHGAITDPNVKHMWDAFRHLTHHMTVNLRIREGLIERMRRPREDDEE